MSSFTYNQKKKMYTSMIKLEKQLSPFVELQKIMHAFWTLFLKVDPDPIFLRVKSKKFRPK